MIKISLLTSVSLIISGLDEILPLVDSSGKTHEYNIVWVFTYVELFFLVLIEKNQMTGYQSPSFHDLIYFSFLNEFFCWWLVLYVLIEKYDAKINFFPCSPCLKAQKIFSFPWTSNIFIKIGLGVHCSGSVSPGKQGGFLICKFMSYFISGSFLELQF